MTTQTVERDPATGLALLPEGYIWRVASTNRYLTLKLVLVTTKTLTGGMWWWKYEYPETSEKVVEEAYYDTHFLAPKSRTKEAIADGLARLSDTMYKEYKDKQDQWGLMKSFWGDYPPKKLS